MGIIDMKTPVPAWYAAKRAGVSKQVFHYWRTSGKVAPAVDEHGEPITDRDNNPMYRLGDVLAAEAETRRSPNSSRNPRRGTNWAELDRKPSGSLARTA